MATTLDTYPAAVREALAVHEMLRRCGFAPDTISILHSCPPEPLHVILRTQGRQFAVACGPLGERLQDHAFAELWKGAVRRYNGDAPKQEIDALLASSKLFQMATGLVAMLIAKGFVLGPDAKNWARA